MKNRRSAVFFVLAVVFFVLGVSNRGASGVYLGAAAALFVLSVVSAIKDKRKIDEK